MIGKLTGLVDSSSIDGSVLIDVQGVGYVVRLPTQGGALPLSGHITLFIHTAVREDAIDLYGFVTEEELQFFKQLMGVSGVGPKTALGIMSVADVSSLKRAIAQSDSVTLIKVYGLGKKSAERLVVELRDKIKSSAPADMTKEVHDGDVIEALIALGYRADESRKIAKEIPSDIRGTKERIAAALRQMGQKVS